MPDAVKTSSWKCQFKAHDKSKKRLLTGAKAAERDANKRKQEATDRERRLREKKAQALTFRASEPLLRPCSSLASSASSVGEEEKEEALIPPLSTAPAALTVSRAGCKRAPTMKALEAETAPKQVTGQGGGRWRGRGGRATK